MVKNGRSPVKYFRLFTGLDVNETETFDWNKFAMFE